jgi:hypothetical protein
MFEPKNLIFVCNSAGLVESGLKLTTLSGTKNGQQHSCWVAETHQNERWKSFTLHKRRKHCLLLVIGVAFYIF